MRFPSELLKQLVESDKIFIMYHKSPDPDAIGSAIALARILRSLGKKVEVFKERNLNDQVSEMVKISGEDLVGRPSFSSGLLVVVDTSSLSMLDQDVFNSFRGRKIAIDHHAEKDSYPGFDLVFVDDTATATAILIYELAKELGAELDEISAKLLGIAIITDTANFVVADPRTFSCLAEITRLVDYQDISTIVNMPMNHSERLARLKGASRLELFIVDNWIIAVSKVSSFEGSVARALIELGADVSFVGSSNDHTRISARARQELVKMGLHLGRDIMPKIAETFGGDAGGHPGAAGANGFDKSRLDDALQLCVDEVTFFIKRKSKTLNV